jgi:hypothetical protein
MFATLRGPPMRFGKCVLRIGQRARITLARDGQSRDPMLSVAERPRCPLT